MNINNIIENAINLEFNVQDFIKIFCNESEAFSLLKEFKNTEQDKDWHSEGDVEIHTNMVLKEMYEIIKKNNLNKEKAKILVLAALFHDICKPLVTKPAEKDGVMRIVAPKHEVLGRSYLLFELINIKNLSINEIETIVNLVGYHNLPKLAVLRDESLNNFKRIARMAKPELLYYLELADMKGRISNDKEKSIELIEFYKMYNIDYDLWNVSNPYQKEKDVLNKLNLKENQKEFILNNYIYEFENKNIFDIEEEISKSFNYRDKFSELIILSGLSGTGKSTFSNKLKDYNIISLDEIRKELKSDNNKVLSIAKERLKKYLANKENVIVDATNYRRDFREPYISLGFNYKAHVKNVLLLNDFKTILTNNRNRKDFVIESVIENQKKKFQVPEVNEAHSLVMIDNRK